MAVALVPTLVILQKIFNMSILRYFEELLLFISLLTGWNSRCGRGVSQYQY